MLYIKHHPLLGSQYIENNAHLQASIKSLGGHNLVSDSPSVNHFVVTDENLSHINVFNSLGQLVYEQILSSYTNKMDCSAWPSGIYYLSIDTDTGETITKKLVKCK